VRAITIPSVGHAGIISSAHSVITKDPSSEKVMLFPQNDTESMKIFEKISAIFKGHALHAPIAGATLLNFSS